MKKGQLLHLILIQLIFFNLNYYFILCTHYIFHHLTVNILYHLLVEDFYHLTDNILFYLLVDDFYYFTVSI